MRRYTSVILIAAVAGIMLVGALAVGLPNAAFASKSANGGISGAGGAGGVGGPGGVNGNDIHHAGGSDNTHGGNPYANGGVGQGE